MKTFKWTVPEPRHHFDRANERSQLPTIQERVRSPLWMCSAFLFIVAFFLLLGQSDGAGIIFFVPFTFSPMILSLLLGLAASSIGSLLVLLISNVLYFGWFLWTYLNAFYWHPDPQAGIAFVFIGVYSLPVMIPLWLASMFLRRHKSKQCEQVGDGDAEEAV